ncbi:MAG: hypothetical protein COS39_06825 [Hydrogenophilales bacterium CG03_land_8_20_14_0_80_62_28]|nr:MAG: hypothetical protein COS39_06825 [Hydrogenophilales bacterium CG03_land_8_20_14_0_80_62_28]
MGGAGQQDQAEQQGARESGHDCGSMGPGREAARATGFIARTRSGQELVAWLGLAWLGLAWLGESLARWAIMVTNTSLFTIHYSLGGWPFCALATSVVIFVKPNKRLAGLSSTFPLSVDRLNNRMLFYAEMWFNSLAHHSAVRNKPCLSGCHRHLLDVVIRDFAE